MSPAGTSAHGTNSWQGSDAIEIQLGEAQQRAAGLFQDRVKNFEEWELAETREGTLNTRRGNFKGWFITHKRRPDPGDEKDWRTTLGIGIFVDGATGKAELVR